MSDEPFTNNITTDSIGYVYESQFGSRVQVYSPTGEPWICIDVQIKDKNGHHIPMQKIVIEADGRFGFDTTGIMTQAI